MPVITGCMRFHEIERQGMKLIKENKRRQKKKKKKKGYNHNPKSSVAVIKKIVGKKEGLAKNLS